MCEYSGITKLEFDLQNGASEGKYYNEPPQNKNYGVLKLKKLAQQKDQIR